MSGNYDNWGKLVAAVMKKQQYWELAHLSRSPSICSEASDESSPSSSFNSSVHDADFDMSVPSSPSRLQKAFSKLHQKLVASPSIGRVLGQPLSDIHISYKFGREISRTQFRVTYLVTHRATRQTFTCKSIGTQKLVTAADVADVQREVNIMHHLAGIRNIVELKEVFEDRYNVHLVMELCAGGELFDRIIAKGYYSEREAADVCRQMVTVVHTCHSLGVMHRDLKPENFLLLSEHEDSLLKATDFRLSVFFRPGDVFSDVVGSAYYVAPEVLRRSYGEEADIWSVGVILYILLSSVPPFWGENGAEIVDAVLWGHLDFSCDPWPSISSSAKDLVKKMLVTSPEFRFTAVEVLSHPWMTG